MGQTWSISNCEPDKPVSGSVSGPCELAELSCFDDQLLASYSRAHAWIVVDRSTKRSIRRSPRSTFLPKVRLRLRFVIFRAWSLVNFKSSLQAARSLLSGAVTRLSFVIDDERWRCCVELSLFSLLAIKPKSITTVRKAITTQSCSSLHLLIRYEKTASSSSSSSCNPRGAWQAFAPFLPSRLCPRPGTAAKSLFLRL